MNKTYELGCRSSSELISLPSVLKSYYVFSDTVRNLLGGVYLINNLCTIERTQNRTFFLLTIGPFLQNFK